ARGQAANHPSQHQSRLNADDPVMGTGHAEICNVGSASGQYLFVGSLDMGVSADDNRRSAIEVPAHGEFLAGRLGVVVPHYYRNPASKVGNRAISGPKRAVSRWHENPALNVDNSGGRSRICCPDPHAPARRVGWIVQGSKQSRLVLDILEYFLLIKD